MYVPCLDNTSCHVDGRRWKGADSMMWRTSAPCHGECTSTTRERINSCGRSLDWLPHASHASFTHASDLCHVKGFAAATRDDRPSLYAEFSLERLIQLLFGRACNVDG